MVSVRRYFPAQREVEGGPEPVFAQLPLNMLVYFSSGLACRRGRTVMDVLHCGQQRSDNRPAAATALTAGVVYSQHPSALLYTAFFLLSLFFVSFPTYVRL